jgi:hypothetical protein
MKSDTAAQPNQITQHIALRNLPSGCTCQSRNTEHLALMKETARYLSEMVKISVGRIVLPEEATQEPKARGGRRSRNGEGVVEAWRPQEGRRQSVALTQQANDCDSREQR